MVGSRIAVTGSAWRYAAGCFLVALVASVTAFPVALLALTTGLAVLWFHRDPPRQPPSSGIVAPADGRVSVIREEGDHVRVGVFMNVTDVHINRAPASGTVQSVDHKPGANRPAFSKDSDRNERVCIDAGEYTVVLIAGWFARRIHPAVAVGDDLQRGQRIGHISFGSRADVVLPQRYSTADILVSDGDRVTAGETRLVATDD
jgi:phosphatidylserine decarboxylase precursor-related protein